MPKQVTKTQVQQLLEKADRISKTELKRSKIVPATTRGDILASGGASASYSNSDISRVKWDMCFMDATEFRRTYKMSKKRAEELYG